MSIVEGLGYECRCERSAGLQNMSAVERTKQFARKRATRISKEDDLVSCLDLPVLHCPSENDEKTAFWTDHLRGVRHLQQYYEVRDARVHYMW